MSGIEAGYEDLETLERCLEDVQGMSMEILEWGGAYLIDHVMEIERDRKCVFTTRQIYGCWFCVAEQMVDGWISNVCDDSPDMSPEDVESSVRSYEAMRPSNNRRHQLLREMMELERG